MSKSNELQEIQDLQDQLQILKQENAALKKELNNQLNIREKELESVSKLLAKQNQLEKRYMAIRNSSLGKITVKYWNVRKKVFRSKREVN